MVGGDREGGKEGEGRRDGGRGRTGVRQAGGWADGPEES